MIVINKIDDNPAFDLDRNTLTQKYKNIEGFYRVSCKNGTGLDEFKKALTKAIPRIELLQTPVAYSWQMVKEKLEAATIKKNYIDHQEFESIRNEEQINDESSRDTLIRFLNELGIVLHFRELDLRNFHVLNPRWVTEAVYKIINSQFLADQKGILDTDKLNFVLNEEKIKTKEYDQKLPHIPYKVNEQSYILSLMEYFELCYTLSDNRILIPDLLDKKTPHFEIDDRDALRYIVQYDFLPRNVISRFIVRMHKDIKDDLRWRTGVVLEDRELQTTAVIKSDENDREISILVTGYGKQKRDYFSTIRKTIRDINDSFEKLESKELVPLPDNRNEFVEYRELIGLEQMGELEIPIGRLRKKYPVKLLLDGIESESEREKYVSKYDGSIHFHGNVYSNKIEEVNKMSNQNITFGNNATFHGDFVVAEKIRDSFNKIGTSNSSAELKTFLKALTEEVGKIAEKLDKDKAEEIANDLQAFTNEALSKNPRRKFWQLSAEGIKEAAKTVGELGLSAIKNVDKVIPILDKLL
jgi:internalin A